MQLETLQRNRRGDITLIRSFRPGVYSLILLLASSIAAAAQDLQWPVRLRLDIERVAQIEWRLREAAGARCPGTIADIGASFDDRAAYPASDGDLLRQTVGLGIDPVVAAVVVDGPAWRAGVRAGDAVLSLNGESARKIVDSRQVGEPAQDALLIVISTQPDDRPVSLGLSRNGTTQEVKVSPARHCNIRVVLETDRSVDAHSDSRNVAVSTGLVTLASNDDELALAVAHEFGHVINGHRKTSSLTQRRAMEDVADIAGAQLATEAGYDLTRGVNLFHKLARRDILPFLRAPTHRSYAARIKRIQETLGSQPGGLNSGL